MVGSEARLVGQKKARVFKIGKELERDQTFKSSPVNNLTLVSCIDALTHDLHSWMSLNRLCLNSAKAQLIWFGMGQPLLTLDLLLLTDRFASFTYSSSVLDLGVILDCFLTFSDHISI